MLNPSDVYVEGGSDDLLVCWTDKVTKYDASSFYNWEMDNLPLHDLEERTHLLWERLGNPTSSITGMSFIVSAHATESCSPLYFTTLSSCLEALPEVINCPILVEVASFSGLGSIEITNKVFGSNGSLEIINRNCGFAGGTDLSNKPMSLDTIDSFAAYSLANQVSSLYNASAPSVSFDNFNSFMYSNGGFIASTTNRWEDPRFDAPGHYVFTRRVGRDQLGVMTASLSSTGAPWNTAETLAKASSGLNFIPHDKTYRTQELMDSYDASTYSEIAGGDPIFPPAGLTTGVISEPFATVAAFSYMNSLDSIKVTNCDGPIYIRNFTVDGQNSIEKGIEISNSTVNLERCSSSRCTKAGLFATNSRVNLLRGFVAFRNYDFSGGVRVGEVWNDKIQSYTSSSIDSYGAGIYAENSTIDFQSTYLRDRNKASEAAALVYTTANYTGNIPCPSQEALYCLSRNDIGIHALNSNIIGGRTELNGSAATAWQDATQVFSELNTEAGVRLYNCSLNMKGRFTTYGNYFGIDALNSDMSFDFLKAYANQKDALKLDGCSLKYNNNIYRGYLTPSLYTDAKNKYLQHQVTLLLNGGALNAKNSTIEPVYTSAMDDMYASFFVSGTHGVYKDADTTNNIKPNIILDGSKLDAIHASIYTESNGGKDKPCFGEAISARNGSVVYLRGSGEYANKIFGGESNVSQHKRAGLCAKDNSKISLQGPTVIAQFGVDVLADNNSEIEICPPRDSEGTLMASSFNLSDPANHTMVELHSTRACIVADNGSVVNMQDLGSYHDLWPSGIYGSAIDLGRLDYLTEGDTGVTQYVTNVSGGSLQLYPNANLNNTDISFTAPLGSLTRNFTKGTFVPQNYYYLKAIALTPGGDFSASTITTGGMAVRAINKSKINVTNVHFPTGWNQTSSVVYDFSGVGMLQHACTRTHIWNIADDSILRANYLSVSGLHPQDAGYVGPSGVWEGAGTDVASGAPSSSPDTSSLSVLDYYGPDYTDQNIFGASSPQNYGPFRLYFSVDPLANYLVDASGQLVGYPIQVFAQGYNFSGSLSAPGTVSSVHTKALFSPSYYTISDAGFYYASSMVHSPFTVKAFLDDSAANTFANAKHNTVGKSGLATTVRIYDPFNEGLGGDSTSIKTTGRGLASVNNFDLKKDN